MIRLDMSEYMERYIVSKFVGFFFGYVGYGEGGVFIEVVCCCLFIVIFMDEIEKVYFDVFNMLF